MLTYMKISQRLILAKYFATPQKEHVSALPAMTQLRKPVLLAWWPTHTITGKVDS